MAAKHLKSKEELQDEEVNLTVTNFEFNDKVRMHWINEKTNEVGYTEITYEIYNEKFKP